MALDTRSLERRHGRGLPLPRRERYVVLYREAAVGIDGRRQRREFLACVPVAEHEADVSAGSEVRFDFRERPVQALHRWRLRAGKVPRIVQAEGGNYGLPAAQGGIEAGMVAASKVADARQPHEAAGTTTTALHGRDRRRRGQNARGCVVNPARRMLKSQRQHRRQGGGGDKEREGSHHPVWYEHVTLAG